MIRGTYSVVNNSIKVDTIRVLLNFQVVTYVVTRPGRELLFTVVSKEEKYKAKV